MAIRIGTSGFIYDHWRGRFYQPSARGAELEHYARTFDTVELNVTFYRMPPSSTFRSWAARVPDDFLFAVKASRFLTHVRRLKAPQSSVDLLIERSSELGPHLGPFLIQLPPDLELDLAALEATLDEFPPRFRVAVEPRHASWFVEDVRRVLADRNAALCVADRRGPVTPLWQTADWTYLRFHAGHAEPRSCYGATELERWAERVEPWGPDPAGFAYFNNDGNGCALRDASVFAKALEARGVRVSSSPLVGDEVVLDPGLFVPDPAGRKPVAPGGAWGAVSAATGPAATSPARDAQRRSRARRGGAGRCQSH